MSDANVMRMLNGLAGPILAPVESLASGGRVLQLACGTGGLSLELARRRPDLVISAIDVNPGVLDVGRAEATAQNLTVDFAEMSIDKMRYADESMDAVISRMGLFLPGTAPFPAAAAEAARVLRPGGLLSIATWTDLASSPYTGFGLPLLREFLPAGTVPDMETAFAEATRPAALDAHLSAAGFTDVNSSWIAWDTEYPDFASWWGFMAGFGPQKEMFAALNQNQIEDARTRLVATLSPYVTATGSYRIPARARLITAGMAKD